MSITNVDDLLLGAIVGIAVWLIRFMCKASSLQYESRDQVYQYN